MMWVNEGALKSGFWNVWECVGMNTQIQRLRCLIGMHGRQRENTILLPQTRIQYYSTGSQRPLVDKRQFFIDDMIDSPFFTIHGQWYKHFIVISFVLLSMCWLWSNQLRRAEWLNFVGIWFSKIWEFLQMTCFFCRRTLKPQVL